MIFFLHQFQSSTIFHCHWYSYALRCISAEIVIKKLQGCYVATWIQGIERDDSYGYSSKLFLTDRTRYTGLGYVNNLGIKNSSSEKLVKKTVADRAAGKYKCSTACRRMCRYFSHFQISEFFSNVAVKSFTFPAPFQFRSSGCAGILIPFDAQSLLHRFPRASTRAPTRSRSSMTISVVGIQTRPKESLAAKSIFQTRAKFF